MVSREEARKSVERCVCDVAVSERPGIGPQSHLNAMGRFSMMPAVEAETQREPILTSWFRADQHRSLGLVPPALV
ncbi:hypothetical protein PoB_002520600 [Plakobranchus ocellatus]|uniref:Uncharacterized protein n=1 Tax=Plakobranchus ocellatus TaxID=259542 RepID=A0AAV3ZRV1_9GAST|nr:hypothetical protein PoB_002520600 [Plakobranchus ocellatus]